MNALVYVNEGYYDSAPFSTIIALSNDKNKLIEKMRECVNEDIEIDEETKQKSLQQLEEENNLHLGTLNRFKHTHKDLIPENASNETTLKIYREYKIKISRSLLSSLFLFIHKVIHKIINMLCKSYAQLIHIISTGYAQVIHINNNPLTLINRGFFTVFHLSTTLTTIITNNKYIFIYTYRLKNFQRKRKISLTTYNFSYIIKSSKENKPRR